MTPLSISFIIPVYNEVDNLSQLYSELLSAIKGVASLKNYEILYIDDGSTDGSFELLSTITKNNKLVKIIRLPENRGKSVALNVGIHQAFYPVLLTMDSDLQDVPSQMIHLLAMKQQGFNIVSGFKENRQDKKLIILASRIINKFLSFLYSMKIQDINSGYKIMDKEIFNNLILIEGLHRYIPLFAISEGYTYGEVPVLHRRRTKGTSKYSLLKVFPGFFDLMFVLLVTKQFFKLLSILILFFSFLSSVYLIVAVLLKMPLTFFFMILLTFFHVAYLLYLKYKKYVYVGNNVL